MAEEKTPLEKNELLNAIIEWTVNVLWSQEYETQITHEEADYLEQTTLFIRRNEPPNSNEKYDPKLIETVKIILEHIFDNIPDWDDIFYSHFDVDDLNQGIQTKEYIKDWICIKGASFVSTLRTWVLADPDGELGEIQNLKVSDLGYITLIEMNPEWKSAKFDIIDD